MRRDRRGLRVAGEGERESGEGDLGREDRSLDLMLIHSDWWMVDGGWW